MESVEQLGQAVEERRRALAITQEELAFSVGVNRRVISELERGKPTLQLGIALRTIATLGLEFDVRPRT